MEKFCHFAYTKLLEIVLEMKNYKGFVELEINK